MDTRLIRNHPLFPPILISSISLLGICVILAVASLPRPNIPVTPTETVTPFKYLLLATETLVPTTVPETTVPTGFLPVPETSLASDAKLILTTTPQGGTPIAENSLALIGQPENGTDESFTPTLAITIDPIFTSSVPLMAGTYDAGNSQIIRNGNWVTQNSEGAFQNTLMVSNKAGNYLAFSFTGYRLSLGYQGDENAGDMAVSIDGSEETVEQQTSYEWFSAELEPGTHFAILTHENGSHINLDYIVIVE